MLKNMMLVGTLCCILGSAQAADFDNTELGRQFSSFSLNSTTLTNIAAGALVALLLVILALVKFRDYRPTVGGKGQTYSKNGGEEVFDEYKQRSGNIDDFTNQLYLLAEAFTKYGVTETGCQLYATCTASYTKNDSLSKIITEIMSTLVSQDTEGLFKDDPYMRDLMKSFKTGYFGSDCEKYKDQCNKPKSY
ncbi:uncharacterized protein LOC111704462 [Eurytemora carolleeae]|uniref:uncharacterized protein LOC111704462 n=1 Tax=Eurytemora carolleeae TaxID=1294199 RepID=UPI000C76F459|nr:uncharacterized protein LOC111704462 [Eurytemora carolleeae]|eukprot:XP_023332467.1 uncharacterized protein LOC111704462 [Eurytemora affinis]